MDTDKGACREKILSPGRGHLVGLPGGRRGERDIILLPRLDLKRTSQKINK
jgi:hypothetical protein